MVIVVMKNIQSNIQIASGVPVQILVNESRDECDKFRKMRYKFSNPPHTYKFETN